MNPKGNLGSETAKSLPVCKSKPEVMHSCNTSVKSSSLDSYGQPLEQIDDYQSCENKMTEFGL